jgi:hypothetical protein
MEVWFFWRPPARGKKIDSISRMPIGYAVLVKEEKELEILWPPHTTLDAASAALKKAYRDAGVGK